MKVSVDGMVAVLAFDRAEQRNAMRPGDLRALLAAIDEQDRAGRAVVLAGEGATFCAGFDLKLCVEDAGATGELLRLLSACVARLSACDVPVVAAVQGAAVAGGAALLGGVDVVVAEPGTRIGYTAVRVGLSPAVSGPFLAGQVAHGDARGMFLDTRLLSASEAMRIGLVSEIVAERSGLLARAIEWAGMLREKPREGWRATRAWLGELQSVMTPMADGDSWIERGLETSLGTAASPEARERLAAALRA